MKKSISMLIVLAAMASACGERPLRPKVHSQENGNDGDSAEAMSKMVAHLVTATSLKSKFKVRYQGKTVIDECDAGAVTVDGITEKFSIQREKGPFGERALYVVAEFKAVGTARPEAMVFDLITTDCAGTETEKALDLKLTYEEIKSSDPKPTLLGFAVEKL